MDFFSQFSCTCLFLALLEVLVAPGGLDWEVVLGHGPLAAAGAAVLGHPVLFLGLLSVEALSRSVMFKSLVCKQLGLVK